MSNIDPAEFIADISALPVEQQINLVMDYIRKASAQQELNFVKHPAVVAWISANTKAINATVVIPKSHGGPGR